MIGSFTLHLDPRAVDFLFLSVLGGCSITCMIGSFIPHPVQHPDPGFSIFFPSSFTSWRWYVILIYSMEVSVTLVLILSAHWGAAGCDAMNVVLTCTHLRNNCPLNFNLPTSNPLVLFRSSILGLEIYTEKINQMRVHPARPAIAIRQKGSM
ncbi:hypothetical protein B0H19DRAFT_294699 [Mycena capillaripes]|nr:hypothetical protein B0H19DRAFT_294699 [Mycena capillaripes]